MASKTIAWADQSGDVITMTAPAWSGSQTVTLSTPENFGIARELNIVFYSESNPAVSATLNVKQAEATLNLSETSLVFASDDTSKKTVTVTTNMSTLDGAQLTLEGDAASDFTLSGLSALSNGQATFTIKPNSINTSQDPRNVTIKLTAGRLATRSLPVTQDVDPVESVTYDNYKATFQEGTYGSSPMTDQVQVSPGSESLGVSLIFTRDKVTTYLSGGQERVEVPLPRGTTFRAQIGLQFPSITRLISNGEVSITIMDDTGRASVSGDLNSLGSTLISEEETALSWSCTQFGLESTAVVDSPTFISTPNERIGYTSFEVDSDLSLEFEYSDLTAKSLNVFVTAIVTYTSLFYQRESIPCQFVLQGSQSYFSITFQASATAGTAKSTNRVSVKPNQENYSGKDFTAAIQIKPKSIDTAIVVGTINLVQKYYVQNTIYCRIVNNSSYTMILQLIVRGVTTMSQTVSKGEEANFPYTKGGIVTLSGSLESGQGTFLIKDSKGVKMNEVTMGTSASTLLAGPTIEAHQSALPFSITEGRSHV